MPRKNTISILLLALILVLLPGAMAQEAETEHDHAAIAAALAGLQETSAHQQEILDDVQKALVVLIQEIAALQEDLAAQATKQDTLSRDQQNLTASLGTATARIDAAVDAIAAMEAEVNALSTLRGDVAAASTGIKTYIQETQVDVEPVRQEVQSVDARVDELEAQVTALLVLVAAVVVIVLPAAAYIAWQLRGPRNRPAQATHASVDDLDDDAAFAALENHRAGDLPPAQDLPVPEPRGDEGTLESSELAVCQACVTLTGPCEDPKTCGWALYTPEKTTPKNDVIPC